MYQHNYLIHSEIHQALINDVCSYLIQQLFRNVFINICVRWAPWQIMIELSVAKSVASCSAMGRINACVQPEEF